MEVIDGDGRRAGVVKPTPHLPLPEGDVRRAELTFPFDLVWLPMSGTAFRADVLRRILPIPEEEYPVCGADWYLVHLSTLLGTVRSLDDVAACYRVHGTNRYEPQSSSLDLDHVRHGLVHAAATTHALTRLAGDEGLELPYPRILSVADLSNRLVSLEARPVTTPDPDRQPREPPARRHPGGCSAHGCCLAAEAAVRGLVHGHDGGTQTSRRACRGFLPLPRETSRRESRAGLIPHGTPLGWRRRHATWCC